jgi:hypothetical protein
VPRVRAYRTRQACERRAERLHDRRSERIRSERACVRRNRT